MQNKILIIAGSDPSGGAGIQADIKTATSLKTYCSTIITSLTAQNTKEVSTIYNLPIEFLQQQLESVLSDIKFDAIKIGMLNNMQIIEFVTDFLKKKAKKVPIILDPVMVATSGDILMKKNAINSLKKLIKISKVVTPNIHEAEILTGVEIEDVYDMEKCAIKIKKMGAKNVFIKSGDIMHRSKKVLNLLLDENGNFHQVSNRRIRTKPLHGTGCTLSCAIACNIAQKREILQSVRNANKYVYKAILRRLEIGKGSLVLGH